MSGTKLLRLLPPDMGLDGGTYITRNDVLRGQCWDLNKADTSRSTRGGSIQGTHKRAKLDHKAARQTKWTTCALSEQPLKAPIVADFLGSLYNKLAVLEFLLGRTGNFVDAAAEHRYLNQLNANGTALDHLQSRRDVFSVHLEDEAELSDSKTEPEARNSLYCCPVTAAPCVAYPFSAIATCGHVFSDRALQQMTEQRCGICDKPFLASSLIPINGSSEQIAVLQEQLDERPRAKRKRECSSKSLRGEEQSKTLVEESRPPKRPQGAV